MLETQSSISVATDRATVKEVLAIVDSVVIPHGLKFSSERTATHNDPTLEAYYHLTSGPQNPSLIRCLVHTNNGSINISFLEMGKLRSSNTVREMCDSLQRKLSDRYGADKVKLNNKK
jgi:hypothetical protein